LRQWTFGCVDEQNNAVNNVESSFHFPTKVGVTWGVDQVDAGSLVGDLGGFGQNGDSAFALLVIGVHDSLNKCLVSSEGARGTQQGVDKRGFAVVNVGYKGDISTWGHNDQQSVRGERGQQRKLTENKGGA
jgi:hypothetical protein